MPTLNKSNLNFKHIKNAEFWKILSNSYVSEHSDNLLAPVAFSKLDNKFIGSFTNFCDLSVFMILLNLNKNISLQSLEWMITYVYKYLESSINYLRVNSISKLMENKIKILINKTYNLSKIQSDNKIEQTKTNLNIKHIANKVINLRKNIIFMKSDNNNDNDNKCFYFYRITEIYHVIETNINILKLKKMDFVINENTCRLKNIENVINNQGIIKALFLSKVLKTVTKINIGIQICKKIIPIILISLNLIGIEFLMKTNIVNSYNLFCNNEICSYDFETINQIYINLVQALFQIILQTGCYSCLGFFSHNKNEWKKFNKDLIQENKFIIIEAVYILKKIQLIIKNTFSEILEKFAQHVDIEEGIYIVHILFVYCDPFLKYKEKSNFQNEKLRPSCLENLNISENLEKSLIENLVNPLISRILKEEYLFDKV